MELLVRPASDDDLAVAEQLATRVFAELRHIYRPKEDVPPTDDPQLLRLVAETDGRFAGTLLYAIEPDRLHFRALAVDAAFRRPGVARALIAHLDDLAKSRQIATLSLYTIRQTENVSIFERLGFHSFREEPASWAVSDCCDELTEVLMEKQI